MVNQAANEVLASDQPASNCVFQLATRWSTQDGLASTPAGRQLANDPAPSPPVPKAGEEEEDDKGATDQRQEAAGSRCLSHRHASYRRRTPDSHSQAFDVTSAGSVHISAVGLATGVVSPAHEHAHVRCTSPGRHQHNVEAVDEDDIAG